MNMIIYEFLYLTELISPSSYFHFQEIYKDRKKFSKQVFEVASSDLVNMGMTVISYTLKDIRDEEVKIYSRCQRDLTTM